MKIAIFGATDETGRQLVKQALAAGHEIVAYVRDLSRLGINNEHLRIIEGEMTNEELIESAVTGANAVISALGPRDSSKNNTLTHGMQNIILQQ
jgi:putative NADH-flavin reductase